MTRAARLAAFFQWLCVGGAVGCATGVASAVFLKLLERATEFRVGHGWLVYCLPVAGLFLGLIYERFGTAIAPGSNLVIDAIHDDGPKIPARMAPMVLVGTVLTHLFGGSAGREGTAVQMGASMADALAHRFQRTRKLRQHFLAAGVAGGFGSVFGTPIAGALFGLEFIVLGRMDYSALLPALVAALIGDSVTRGLGVIHTPYPTIARLDLSVFVLAKLLAFGLIVAMVAAAFIELTHALKKYGTKIFPRLPVRMAVGGAALVVLYTLVGSGDYLGLGVPGIVRAFSDPTQPPYAFALKLIFTAVTLSAGFLGGEVTPLFFVGAALGNTLAQLLDLPLAMGAGLGLAGVFAAAANTPLALAVMAVELLGREMLPHAAVVCVAAYIFAGHRSIYPAQRVARDKAGTLLPLATPLRDWHTLKKD